MSEEKTSDDISKLIDWLKDPVKRVVSEAVSHHLNEAIRLIVEYTENKERAKIAELEKQNRVMKEALKYYADQDNSECVTARQALAGLKEKGE